MAFGKFKAMAAAAVAGFVGLFGAGIGEKTPDTGGKTAGYEMVLGSKAFALTRGTDGTGGGTGGVSTNGNTGAATGATGTTGTSATGTSATGTSATGATGGTTGQATQTGTGTGGTGSRSEATANGASTSGGGLAGTQSAGAQTTAASDKSGNGCAGGSCGGSQKPGVGSSAANGSGPLCLPGQIAVTKEARDFLGGVTRWSVCEYPNGGTRSTRSAAAAKVAPVAAPVKTSDDYCTTDRRHPTTLGAHHSACDNTNRPTGFVASFLSAFTGASAPAPTQAAPVRAKAKPATVAGETITICYSKAFHVKAGGPCKMLKTTGAAYEGQDGKMHVNVQYDGHTIAWTFKNKPGCSTPRRG